MIIVYFSYGENGENQEKLLFKMAKMRQNRHQCIFCVISFHTGVYFGKYQQEFKSCSIKIRSPAYRCRN